MKMKKIGVIGAGSWGTALAQTLAGKGFEVRIWDLNKEHLAEMREKRENVKYLPGVKLNDNIHMVDTKEEVASGADVLLFAVPAQHFRSGLTGMLPYLKPEMMLVNVAKGIEQKSLKRMSEIAFEVLDGIMPLDRYVVLSGPSHAEEVIKALPTTVAVACKDPDTAREAQDLFMTDFFRVYTNDDIVGVELGGSLKNIIALGAGISDGMGFGDNAKAAMMTRGIAEMARLGAKLGADVHTFSGLTGIGDLIVTCTSVHSRNRRCGMMIGQGIKPSEATERVGMVVEGMFTTEAAYELAKRVGVEMPITEMIYKVITEQIDAREAVPALMKRDKKAEKEDLV